MGVPRSGLIPAKFLMLCVHMGVTAMALRLKGHNIAVTIQPSDAETEAREYEDAEVTLDWLLSMSMLAFAVEFICLFFGLSLHSVSAGLFSVWSHGLGVLFTLWFMLEGWHYMAYAYIFVLGSLLPAMVDAGVASIALFFKSDLFASIDIRI